MKTDDRNIQPDKWDFYYSKNKRIINTFKLIDALIYLWFESSKIFSKYINTNKKIKFIEFGCGGGNFLPYFNKKYDNFEIFGIDISSVGCKITLQRINDNVPPSNIICDDIFKKDFQTQFDISFSVGFIEHFDDPSIPLKKHVDVLKKDGIMLLAIPNLTGLQGKIFKSKIWFSKEKWEKKPKDWIFGMRDISVKQFEKWCKSAGLKDIEIHPAGGFLPTYLIDSLITKKNSKIKSAQIINRYALLPILILLNIPFLFRINSYKFSPYIIGVGKKQ